MWMRVGMLALVIGASITGGEVPFAQRECEKEISERREKYTEAYEQEEISGDLYETVMEFLEGTEEKLTPENCVDVYNDFPEGYKELLLQYPKEEREKCIYQYNADLCYIEHELIIYGAKVHLEFFGTIQEEDSQDETGNSNYSSSDCGYSSGCFCYEGREFNQYD